MRFAEAVADTFVRTAAAVTASGHRAFADRRPVVVDHRAQTRAFQQADDSKRPLPVLRLLPPTFSAGGDSQWVARLGLASRSDTTQVLDAASLWSAADPNNRRYLNAERLLLDAIRRGATVWRPLAVLAEQRHPTEMPLTPALLDSLLGEARQDLGAVGLSVIVPNNELRTVELRPVVYERAESPSAQRPSGLDLGSLLEIHWQGELDGLQIAPAEIEQLVQARQRVISIRGQWVQLEPGQIDQIRNPELLSPSAALAAAVGVPIRVGGVEQQVKVRGTLAALGRRLGELSDPSAVVPPANLVGELRPYQQRGLAWLNEMLDLSLGGILADDMGLGKTIQVLALLLNRRNAAIDDDPSSPAAGTALVVCPASVVRNWEREANKFAPDLRVIRHHGQERELPPLQAGDIVLTTYGVCRRDIDLLAEIPFDVVVADEAQAIKNPASRTARAMRRLQANARFALTGTPVQNQLSDLWAILDWTTPGLLGSLDQFRKDFANPIERQNDERAAEQLSAMLRPFLLRRRKTDPLIAPDLPPKTETSNIVSLFPEQEAIYRTTVETLLGEVEAASGIGRRVSS
ncbi:MAG: SNF2-related protein [Acidimicrobiales bacterium]